MMINQMNSATNDADNEITSKHNSYLLFLIYLN